MFVQFCFIVVLLCASQTTSIAPCVRVCARYLVCRCYTKHNFVLDSGHLCPKLEADTDCYVTGPRSGSVWWTILDSGHFCPKLEAGIKCSVHVRATF